MTEKFKGKTHTVLVWDESGSMLGLQEQGVETIGEQIAAAKEADNVEFTLAYFGTQYPTNYRVVIDHVAAEDLASSPPSYEPQGMTPLHDAVGHTLTELQKRVKKSDRANVIIFTDGHENSSTDFDGVKVAKLVEKLTKKGNYTFTYVAAGIPKHAAFQASASMGMTRTVTTPSTGSGMKGMSAGVATDTARYYSSPIATASPSAADLQTFVDKEVAKEEERAKS